MHIRARVRSTASRVHSWLKGAGDTRPDLLMNLGELAHLDGPAVDQLEVFERGATPRYQPTAPTSVIRIDTS
jgi:hypothetical protein